MIACFRSLASPEGISELVRASYLGFQLVRKPALFGTASMADGWVDRELTSLRHAANQQL